MPPLWRYPRYNQGAVRMSYPRNAWVEKLWKEAEELASLLDGKEVVRALAEASDKVWEAGLDHALMRTRAPLEEAGVGHDISWLTVFVLELWKRLK